MLCIVSLLISHFALPSVAYSAGEGEENWQTPGAIAGELVLNQSHERLNYRLKITQLTGDEPLFAEEYTWEGTEHQKFSFNQLQAGDYKLELFYREESKLVYQLKLAAGETSHVRFFPEQGGNGVLKGSIAFDEDSSGEGFRMSLQSLSGTGLYEGLQTDYTFQSYAFVGLPNGTYNMSANYKDMQQQRNNISLEAGEALSVDYKFLENPVEHGYNLSGLLTSTKSGQQVGSIYLIHNKSTWLTKPNAEGYYSVNDIPAGKYTIVVYAYNPNLDYTVQGFEVNQNLTDFSYKYRDYSREGTGTLQGRVIDADGNPQGFNQIWLKPLGADFSYLPESYSWGGHSDAEGSFIFHDLEPGAYELSAGGGMSHGKTNVLITADSETYRDVRTVEYDKARSIQGVVTGFDGTIKTGAPVRLYSLIQDETGELLNETRSSVDGYYFNFLTPGIYIVKAEIDGIESARRFEIGEDETEKTVNIGNEPPVVSRVYIEGQYVIGNPLLATGVGYYDEEDDEQDIPEYQWVSSETEDSGYVAIEGATDNTYMIRPEDAGRYISVLYTPKAKTGTVRGEVVKATPKIVHDLSELHVAGAQVVQGVPFDLDIETAKDYGGFDIDGEYQVLVWQGDTVIAEVSAHFTSGAGRVNNLVIQQLGNQLFYIQVAGATTKKPLDLIVSGNQPPRGEVSIAYEGTALPGSILISWLAYLDPEGDPEGEHDYQWLKANPGSEEFVAIQGETRSTYTVRDQDAGSLIKLRVIPRAASGTLEGEAIYSQAVAIEDLSGISSILPVGQPKAGVPFQIAISGARNYSGELLNGEHNVQLTRGIEGPTDSYPVNFSSGEGIISDILFDEAGEHFLLLKIGNQVSPVGFSFFVGGPNQPTVSIVGNGTPGHELAAVFEWSGEGGGEPGELDYQWQIGGTLEQPEFVPIEGAIGDTYLVSVQDIGQNIRVGVRPKAVEGMPEFEFEFLYSEPVEIKDLSNIGYIYPLSDPIAGQPFDLVLSEVKGYSGEVLNGIYTVKVKNADRELASRELEFTEGSAIVQGVTIETEGDYEITVQVAQAASPRTATITVLKAVMLPTGTLTVSGNPLPGHLLSAQAVYSSDNEEAEGTHNFQWSRSADGESFEAIQGANSDAYTVQPEDVGYYIRAEVVFRTREGAGGNPVYSVSVRIINDAQPVTGITFIDTNPGVGIVSGVVRWNTVADESRITGYSVYFTDRNKQRIGNVLGEALKGLSPYIPLNRMQVPADAVYIAVFVKTDSGIAAEGALIALEDSTSTEEVRRALKNYLFPNVLEVNIEHIMSVIRKKTDINGDGVFDKEDARLILSLIGMTS
ncbi:hypothetical protein ACFOQM_11640 [Paenibacillus sp. GCM10012307]|uniref:AIR9-like A9 domain-containing protein n=1 Tax=Paenibacillus roseus TaxID=2798579 RepID=A0A934J5I3_9BACL|nr:hypothetical protein [Paenibacillus roseus]MBJ6361938.1 hypothetical protein [Paenibacillus roseus]